MRQPGLDETSEDDDEATGSRSALLGASRPLASLEDWRRQQWLANAARWGRSKIT